MAVLLGFLAVSNYLSLIFTVFMVMIIVLILNFSFYLNFYFQFSTNTKWCEIFSKWTKISNKGTVACKRNIILFHFKGRIHSDPSVSSGHIKRKKKLILPNRINTLQKITFWNREGKIYKKHQIKMLEKHF